MIENRKLILTWVVAFGIALAIGVWWLNRGYGEVSRQTYEFSMALYSACQSRSDERLSKIEELLSEADVEELPANERRWLEAIIARAQNNHWEAAANNARQMMEDQVTY